jgi:hypothetical protein
VALQIAGAVGFGLVWGWLLLPLAPAADGRGAAWLAATSLLAATELWLLTGPVAVAAGVVAALGAVAAHQGGWYWLRARG